MGGRSGEHEVSIISANSVINALDKKKYQVVPIGITKNGQWISGSGTVRLLKQDSPTPILDKILLPDPRQKSLISLKSRKKASRPLDVIFPVLHGTYGEDGKIQGLLELADIPYVGSGVLGSAVAMDKIIQKKLFIQSGFKTPDFIFFNKSEWIKQQLKIIRQIIKKLGLPVFIKPANLGSSVGISKVKDKKLIKKAVNEALRYDLRIIVEKAVSHGREIECAVLGNDQPVASAPGEIVPGDEFYSYQDKYINNRMRTIIPAPISLQQIKSIQNSAVAVFKLLDLKGLARVDFFIDQSGQVLLSEVNTMPGFTSISMYPKLWEYSGLPYSKLLDKLIDLALERHQQKNQLKFSYRLKPKI